MVCSGFSRSKAKKNMHHTMMTTQATAAQPTTALPSGAFHTGQVLVIAVGHFVHDVFTSLLAPLLPLIIEQLGLSLTQAASLTTFMQVPSLINPFMGLMADRVSLRWFVIMAPTLTATAMSLIGLAPAYAVLAILLLTTGFSSAAWHVPAPVMIARASGRRVGRGMSFFMLGGELARTVGPLLAVAAVSWWGLAGTYRLIPLGMAASVVLYCAWRNHHIAARPAARSDDGSWRAGWRPLIRAQLPLAGIVLSRGFMTASLTAFLPTLLTSEGATLEQASFAFAAMEFAAAIGALTSGTVSDRLGRRRVLAFVTTTSPALMLVFLSVQGWAAVPVLVVLGFVALSTGPVLMALVQECGRDHPATANGLFMGISFLGRAVIVVLVGAMADQWGLRTAFRLSALVGFASILFVLLLPKYMPAANATED
jgi:FSR family fosmidomycin resistance protein-like MFS transporter